MSRALLDEAVACMPVGCCLAVHHFGGDAPSLKSGKPIKGNNPDACGLTCRGELAARYAGVLRVLLEEEDATVEGRQLFSFLGQKLEAEVQQQAQAEGIIINTKNSDRLLVELVKYAGAWAARQVGSGDGGETFFIRKSSLRDAGQWSSLQVGNRVSMTIKRAAGRGIVTDAVLES